MRRFTGPRPARVPSRGARASHLLEVPAHACGRARAQLLGDRPRERRAPSRAASARTTFVATIDTRMAQVRSDDVGEVPTAREHARPQPREDQPTLDLPPPGWSIGLDPPEDTPDGDGLESQL